MLARENYIPVHLYQMRRTITSPPMIDITAATCLGILNASV